MLITFLSWVCIFLFTVSLGFTVGNLLEKAFHIEIKSIFSFSLIGIVSAAVYSEFFSLFYKVGKAAVLILAVICCAGAYCSRHCIARCLKTLRDPDPRQKTRTYVLILLLALIIFFGSFFTAGKPGNYDTDNYHAPAIRWLEEYGIVKGLGNLHTRFAYNSSFLCLQALFSFKWLLGYSLHSVNGYIWAFMACFALSGLFIFHGRKLLLSDMLRFLLLGILFSREEISAAASPNTDFLPMCLCGYVFIRRSSLTERKEADPGAYVLPALLGIFAVSVKLSAVMLLLFSLKPFIGWLRRREGRRIAAFVAFSFIMLLPFVLRNIILSGYILYPVPELGFLAKIPFLHIDWQLPGSVTVSDEAVITLFARKWSSGFTYQEIKWPFYKWLWVWIKRAGDFYDLALLVSAAISFLTLPRLLSVIIRKKSFEDHYALHLIGMAGFWFLFFAAPSPRFGKWWFWFLPAEILYFLIKDAAVWLVPEPASVSDRKLIMTGVFLSLLIGSWSGICLYRNEMFYYVIRPADYTDYRTKSQYEEINDIRFYYYWPFIRDEDEGTHELDPEKYNLNGYYAFPGTECKALLRFVEMRGDTLAEGFRPKEEFRDANYDFQGKLLYPDEITALGLDR